MPHQRPRQITPLLLKRLRLWPVLGVVGARQTGKSVLLRELIAPRIRAAYFTMDSKTQRNRATRSPESFTKIGTLGKTQILDEVQKVPDLFDAMKFHVDSQRRPGMFLINEKPRNTFRKSSATCIRKFLGNRWPSR